MSKKTEMREFFHNKKMSYNLTALAAALGWTRTTTRPVFDKDGKQVVEAGKPQTQPHTRLNTKAVLRVARSIRARITFLGKHGSPAGGTFTKVGTYDIAAPLPKVKE